MNIIKIGLLAVGGYLAYDWYKKRNATKALGEPLGIGSVGTDEEDSEIPFSEQPESVQMGDHLSKTQKESYIFINGI